MQSGKQVTLAMDTSSSPLLIVLEKDGKRFIARRKGIKQEKLLFPVLNGLLAKAGAELTDISRVFIIRGPGRFTGIRISLTFASMLKYLNKTEVRGATMFEALRFQAQQSRAFKTWKRHNPAGALAVVLHAFREEYFLQIFDQEQNGPAWLSREELLKRLAEYGRPLFVAGNDKDGAPLGALLGDGYTQAEAKICKLQTAQFLEMARQDGWEKDALEPLYLKPARFELIKPV